MTRRLLPILGLTLAAAACGKVVVLPVTKDMKDEGVFYALPKTVARVSMKVDRQAKQGAQYAMFRPIFAPDTDPVCKIKECKVIDSKTGKPKAVVSYSVQKATTFNTFGEPDPAQIFLVKFKGSGAVDQALSLGWNEAGLLSTATATVTSRTIDIAVSALKAGTSLGIKTAMGASRSDAEQKRDPCRNGSNATDWVIDILATVDPIDSNPLIANYCRLPLKDRDPNEDEDSRDDYDESTDKNALLAALSAYSQVRPLVKARTDLLLGTNNMLAPVAMIDRLDTLIAEQLGRWFVGTQSKKTWDLPFEVRTLDPKTGVRLLAVIESNGVCLGEAPLAHDAQPQPDGFKKLAATDCANAKWINLTVAIHPDKQLFQEVEANVKDKGGDRSFRYVLPAQVKAVVAEGTNEFGAGIFSVAQLGHVVSLPAERNSKTLTYEMTMIEATGGLKAFKLNTTGGVDAGTIDAIAGVGGSLIDERNRRRTEDQKELDEAEAAADELAVLTRERNLLKLRDEICELQKKYGLACTSQP